MRGWLTLVLLGYLATATATPRISIILDDVGYRLSNDRAVIDLPFALTCAVIPGSPNGPSMARLARASGKEVLLHIPMATDTHRQLDPGGLHADITEAELDTTLQEAAARIPEAIGINNHMGSLLTAETQPMTWLMEELKRLHLFFIDSRTTALSVAEDTARAHGVPTRGRDVFLDDEQNLAYINNQFNQLLTLARKHGSAIAIGHPYPATLLYLQKVLPLLKQTGVELVPVSALLPAWPAPLVSTSANIHPANTHH